MTLAPLRVLIVDHSAYNRKNIANVFTGREDIEVVGKAGDGAEALKLVKQLEPDVITLDLEMPRMDGFTFLLILMATQPMPVIVVSHLATVENIARARELGALDFVATPDRHFACDAALRDEILSKVLRVRESPRPTVRTPKLTSQFPGGVAVEVPTLDEAVMMWRMPIELRETWLLRRRAKGGPPSGRRRPPPAAAAAPVLAPGPAPPSLVDAVDEPAD
jgi:two-component system chemotaxis response regulator CheB